MKIEGREFTLKTTNGQKTYLISRHAESRMSRRGISVDDVKKVILNSKPRIRFSESFPITEKLNGITVMIGVNRQIITVFNCTKGFSINKRKKNRNENFRKLKQKFGNRIR